MTLRARVTVLVAVAVAVVVAATSVAAYAFARDEARSEIDAFLRTRGAAAGFANVLDPDEFGRGQGQGPGPGAGRRVVEDDVLAQVVLPQTTIVVAGAGQTLPVDAVDLAVAVGSSPEVIRDVTVDGTHYRMLTRRIGPDAALQVARDVSETDAILAALRLRLLIVGLLGVVVAAAIGWWVSRRSIRPVEELTSAAEHVAATHELSATIPVDRNDEIGRLATSFNEMLGALAEARAGQQRLVADASHELRTPLTSLRTNIELLARGGIPDSEVPTVIADVEAELVELTHVVEELVDLATVGRSDEPARPLDLATVAGRVGERLQRRAPAGITLRLEPTPMEGRLDALTRAVTNLVDNAIKWGGDHGPIEVTLADRRLSVRDHGPGISEADRPRVFDRFYRAPEARTQPGSGLGLSIVSAVVAEHGGTVFVEAADGGGAVVGFQLPR